MGHRERRVIVDGASGPGIPGELVFQSRTACFNVAGHVRRDEALLTESGLPRYFIEDGVAGFWYMTDAVAERKSCSAIPNGTVLEIAVSPKKPFPLSELGIDESKFETFDPSTPPNIGST